MIGIKYQISWFRYKLARDQNTCRMYTPPLDITYSLFENADVILGLEYHHVINTLVILPIIIKIIALNWTSVLISKSCAQGVTT